MTSRVEELFNNTTVLYCCNHRGWRKTRHSSANSWNCAQRREWRHRVAWTATPTWLQRQQWRHVTVIIIVITVQNRLCFYLCIKSRRCLIYPLIHGIARCQCHYAAIGQWTQWTLMSVCYIWYIKEGPRLGRLTVPYMTAGASGISAAVYGMNIIKQVFVVKILAKSRHFPFIGNGSCNSHCSDNVKCMYTM